MEQNKINPKTVVITGSSRGLGFEMAKKFYSIGWNVVINGVNKENLEAAMNKIKNIDNKSSSSSIESYLGDISNTKDIQSLIDFSVKKLKYIDIWINNAGVNQPKKAIYELTENEIDKVLNIDLRGTIMGTRLVTLQMEKQPFGGFIYNIEGFGSNNQMMLGFNLYGTAKSAVTYFTQAYAKELEEKKSKVKIGRLSPGVIITDFLTKPLGGEQNYQLTEKEKNIYNIIGEYPDVVADYLVETMVKTTCNNACIQYLTKSYAFWKFFSALFYKRNFFK